MQNFKPLRQPLLGDLADGGRERGGGGGGEIMPSLMATSLRWRTHSTRTNMLNPQNLTRVYVEHYKNKQFTLKPPKALST